MRLGIDLDGVVTVGEDDIAADAVLRGVVPACAPIARRDVLEDRFHILPSETSGLAVGDRIVVAGQTGLKEGTKVRILEPGDDDGARRSETGL